MDVRHAWTRSVDADRSDGIVDERKAEARHLESTTHDNDDQEQHEERLHGAPMCLRVTATGLRSGIVRGGHFGLDGLARCGLGRVTRLRALKVEPGEGEDREEEEEDDGSRDHFNTSGVADR